MKVNNISATNYQGYDSERLSKINYTTPLVTQTAFNKDSVSFGNIPSKVIKTHDTILKEAFKIFADSRDYEIPKDKAKEMVKSAQEMVDNSIEILKGQGRRSTLKLSKAYMYRAVINDKYSETQKYINLAAKTNKTLPRFSPDEKFKNGLIEKMNEYSEYPWHTIYHLFKKDEPSKILLMRAFILRNTEGPNELNLKKTAIQVLTEDREFKPYAGDIIDYFCLPQNLETEYEKYANVLTDPERLDSVSAIVRPVMKNDPPDYTPPEPPEYRQYL